MVARVTNIWLFWLKFMLATISLTSLFKQKTNSVDFYRIFQNFLPSSTSESQREWATFLAVSANTGT